MGQDRDRSAEHDWKLRVREIPATPWGRLEVENAAIKQRLAEIEAKQQALRLTRQRGQKTAAERKRREADAFAKRVDKLVARSPDETTVTAAVRELLKRDGIRLQPRGRNPITRDWDDATVLQRRRAVRSAVERYRSAKGRR